jgi:hypothetical protein
MKLSDLIYEDENNMANAQQMLKDRELAMKDLQAEIEYLFSYLERQNKK